MRNPDALVDIDLFAKGGGAKKDVAVAGLFWLRFRKARVLGLEGRVEGRLLIL